MPEISLPDGSVRSFAKAVTVAEVAADIGAGLAKAALAGRVNDKLVDTSFEITEDSSLAIVTAKDDDGLEMIRHSTAHLLAQAVKTLFPKAQVTIGPVIEDGFYYDFSYPDGFSESDLEKIEAEMQSLVKQNLPVERRVMKRDEAVTFFKKQGEEYKAEIIAGIAGNEEISLYGQGGFIDLCRGPHVPNTGKLGAFKLTKLAGAYWRGNSNNEMLQRIYGTAWADKKALKTHLTRMEEAEKRDHRKLAKELDLFHMQEMAPGMVFWHPNGWALYQEIERYMQMVYRAHGYQEIKTPQIVDRVLWEKSGHWDKYRENMYTTIVGEREFAVKPMNCPCHVLVFNQGLKSYRDLPLRLAELGSCHRNEPSGALHGLMRVINFVQDDGHIFCTEDQIQSEVSDFIDLVFTVYKDFGFEDIMVQLSTRPPQRIGSDEQWDQAEQALRLALESKGLDYQLNPGDGAFYGPKIDFSLKDSIGRVWQCGTKQVDFQLPGRLGAEYVGEDNARHVPVMLHRAILGSLERFIGILIEEHAGRFPVWLAPQHVAILSITDAQNEYVLELKKTLKKQGLRVVSDLRNEKIGFKIREHTLQRIPYLLIIGKQEMSGQTVAVRTREGQDLGAMSIQAFADRLIEESVNRGFRYLEA
ncbi:MAG: threonine--tRNA ligase [Arenicellales bacterium WSBS_2016_MAG_OTU3]